MFPTQELFRTIACPYYTSGLCERPHCFYRHTKSDVLQARQSESTFNFGSVISDGEEDVENPTTLKKQLPVTQPNICKPPTIQVAAIQIDSCNNNDVDVKPLEDHIRKRPAEDTLENSSKKTRIDKPDKVLPNNNGDTSCSKERSHKTSSSSSKHKSSSSKVSSHNECSSSSSSSKKCSTTESSKKSKSHSHNESNKSSKSSNKSRNHKTEKSHHQKEKKDEASIHSNSAHSNSSENNNNDTIGNNTTNKHNLLDTPEKNNILIAGDKKNSSSSMSGDKKYSSSLPTNKNNFTPSANGDKNLSPVSSSGEKKYRFNPSAPVFVMSPQKKIPSPVQQGTNNSFNSSEHNSSYNTTSPSSSPAHGNTRYSKNSSKGHEPTNNSGSWRNSGQTSSLPSLIPPRVPPPVSQVHHPPSGTISRTFKGRTRVAHKAPSKVIQTTQTSSGKKKPSIFLNPSPSRIANVVRQKYLEQIFDECIKLCSTWEEACKRALAEEAEAGLKSSCKSVYQSRIVCKVRYLRKLISELSPSANGGCAQKNGSTAGNNQHLRVLHSHEQMLNGSAAGNCSIRKIERKAGLPEGNSLYKSLSRFVLTETQLVDNGFPRPHPSGARGRVIRKSPYSDDNYVSEPLRRTCDRCHKVYPVTDEGVEEHPNYCSFHPGRKNRKQVNRQWQTLFTCCGMESGSEGCTIASFHVPKSHPVDKTGGFVSAVKDAGDPDRMGLDDWDIVALDCEMVYTTGGNELARATFVGSKGQILYDQIVKPFHPVLDYNTQYSGLTAEIMSKAEVSMTGVQAILLSHVKPNTILIGHSLESDLIALRFKHDLVIDTSVLFPHRAGPPFKRALRNLSSDYLKKLIQNSEGGHDSAEDAISALNLVYYYLAEDIKTMENPSRISNNRVSGMNRSSY